MKKSKKIFLFAAVLFTLLMIYFAIDFASKTRAPWNKKNKAIKK